MKVFVATVAGLAMGGLAAAQSSCPLNEAQMEYLDLFDKSVEIDRECSAGRASMHCNMFGLGTDW